MSENNALVHAIKNRFAHVIQALTMTLGEITLEIPPDKSREVCVALRDEVTFAFELLLDVCVVDYRDYGISEWQTEQTTLTGFERGVDSSRQEHRIDWKKPRFAVVYHLLSIRHNQRVRLRIFAEGEPPQVPSVNAVWPAANWYEREAFDL